MKIAINTCYGGFGLSRAAAKRYAEIQGRPCYFFQHHDTYVPDPDGSDELSFSAFDIPNPNEVLTHEPWNRMTEQDRPGAIAAYNVLYDQHAIPCRFEHSERADPILIRVIEELGEAANGRFSELKVVEIPDGVEWKIEEYDGVEWIAEKHRTWS